MAPKRRPNPFTIRLAPELRTQLDSLAAEAELSLSALFISAVLKTPPPRKSRRPHPDRRYWPRFSPRFVTATSVRTSTSLPKPPTKEAGRTAAS